MICPRSFLMALPALALAAACGGAEPAPPATPASPAPAASAAPADTSSPAASASAAPSAPPAESAAPVASAAPAPAPASVPPPPKPWDKLNHKERLELMKSAVLPNLKTAFQGYNAKDFADFNCATCHGAKVKDGKFGMPNADLPKLDLKHELKDDIAQHPEMVKFMENTVVAEMATMLGVAPYDLKTKKGFGCEACHTGK